jgi:hypothetical protein
MPISKIAMRDDWKIAEVTPTGYGAIPPVVEGPCDIPDWAIEGMGDIFEQTFFPGRPVRMFLLRDVYVCQEGLIFSESGCVFSGMEEMFSQEQIVAGHRLIQQCLFDGIVQHHSAPALLCKRPTPFVYGHWMIDMLPIVYMARYLPVELASQLSFVIHRTGCTIDNIILESTQRLGIQPNRLLWTTSLPTFFRRLIVVQGLTQNGKYISPLVDACHVAVSTGIAGRGIKRLFVQRRGGYGRELYNEYELSNIARELGFEIFDPGAHTLKEQISAFKDARQIIGAIGSAMTNIIYAPPEAKVTVLTPKSMPDSFYWLVCQLRRQEFREVRCADVVSAATEGRPPWHCDFRLEAGRFRNAIAEFR